MKVLVSSTDWANFIELREHPDAMPEIQQLATLIREELEESVPRRVAEGNWHLPYIDEATCLDLEAYVGGDPRKIDDDTTIAALRLISAARCARVSYTTIGSGSKGVLRAFEDDLALGRRLVESRPIHASPMEHQATPMAKVMRSNNFRGWVQYRKLIPGECVADLPYEGE
jgi:thymidylate synthase ThyX